MKDIRLGRYFYLSEFCRSQWATRHGIIIDPPQHIIDNLRALVVNVLDPLRHEIGPIFVSSGYRPHIVNKGVGGSESSQHKFGQASDLIALKMSTPQVFDTARRMALPFDQLIDEYGQWTHISYGPRNRRQVLRARRVDGKTKYHSV